MSRESKGVRWSTLIYIVIVSALGGLLFGFDSGVISGCEKGMQLEYFEVLQQKAADIAAIETELEIAKAEEAVPADLDPASAVSAEIPAEIPAAPISSP